MNPNQLRLLKIAGIFGILSTIILFICIGMSIYNASWFSWTENWLSELGGNFGESPIWAARGIPSIIFNGGFTLAGIIGILFTILIRKSQIFNSDSGRIGISLLLIDMSALCGIGVFPVTLGKLHVFSSVTFFVLIPVFLLIINFEIRKLYGKKWWWMINILCLISLCSVGAFLLMPDLSGYSKAIAEMVMICSISLFCIFLSLKFLKINFSNNWASTNCRISKYQY